MTAFEQLRKPDLTQKILTHAETPQAGQVLFSLGLAEAIFFPVSAQALLVPMCLFFRSRAFNFALIAAAGSVVGGMIAYMVGVALNEMLMAAGNGPMLVWLGKLQGWYVGYDAVAVAALGFGPVPFALIAVANGLLHGNVVNMLLAAALARGLRYTMVAWLLWKGGMYYKEWLEKNFFGFSMAVSAAFLVLFLLLKLLYISW
jgi:membrane protein YqaA with SNARE-associated domain